MKKLFFVALAMLTLTSTAFAQLGTLDKDLVFTPITPCRLFDTRVSQGGTGGIFAGGTKGFAVWGQTSFASQGGAASNCGLTANADTAAVAVNLTVVMPTAGGYITAYPAGVALPTAATVNFNAGDIKGNFTIVKVQQTGVAPNLNIYSSSTTDVVGDVVGFYSRPVATALNCTNVTGTSVSVPGNTYGYGFGVTCPAGFSAVYLSFNAAQNVLMADSSLNGNSGNFFVKNTDANAQVVTPKITCCQIPGR